MSLVDAPAPTRPQVSPDSSINSSGSSSNGGSPLADEINIAIAAGVVTQGLVSARNGMTPVPLPVRNREAEASSAPQQTSTTVSPSPTGTPAAVVVADSGAEPPGAPVALAPPPEQVLAAAPSTEQATVQASAQAPPSAAAQATVQASTALQATSGAESVALEPSISSGAEASAPLGQEASETPSTQPSPNTSEGEGKDKESSPCDDAGAPLAPAAREARVPAVTEGVAPSKGDVKEYKDAMPEAEETAEEPGKSTAVGTLATGEGLTTPQAASVTTLKDDPGTPEECNLFVGDLARNLTEEKLEKAFQQHGRVMSVSIKRDRATGKNLGYGFVKLSSHQEARAAKEAMQGVELGGRRVRVGWAQKNTSLHVSGLDNSISTEMLVREFSRFGPLDKELTTTSSKSGAYGGFVKFRYRQHAETAKKELNERAAFGGICPKLHIEWNSVDSKDTGNESTAPKDRDGGAGGGNDESTLPRSLSQNQLGRNSRSDASTSSSSSALAPTNAVHVQFEGDQSRVSGVNEAFIRQTFAPWEPVLEVVIPVSKFNGVSPGHRQLPRCWGFVHFPPTADGERAAKDAIQTLNGTTVSEMKVHCTMGRTSGGSGGSSGFPRKQDVGRRPRRGSTGNVDDGRQIMHGSGGRPFRPSGDSSGIPPARAGMRHAAAVGQRHHLPPQPHPIPPQMHQQQHQHPHQLQPPQHPHQPPQQHQHQQHQQQHPLYGYPAGVGPNPTATSAYTSGQYPVVAGHHDGAAAAAAAAAAGASAGEMMVQTPYGMYPYVSFQGVPYVSQQQGYSMGYQMYPGYPYPAGVAIDPSMMQGQIPAGVQVGGQQPHSSPMHQGQGQTGNPAPPLQQQQGQPQPQQQLANVPQNLPQNVPQGVPQTPPQQQQPQQQQQRPPSQLQAQQQQARAAASVQQRQHQQHMGVQHAMLMSGHHPAAAAGLNVGVPPYMPVYQIPHTQGAPGGHGVAPDQSPDQSGGGVVRGGIVEVKRSE
ncbi:unnamed protein product [Ascophyllum nodosum]